MFAMMGEALVHTLKETLREDQFGEKHLQALQKTYAVLSADMVAGGRS